MFTKLKIFFEMIKFEHSVFALPFAFMGAILGSVVLNGHLPSWAQIGWITLSHGWSKNSRDGLESCH